MYLMYADESGNTGTDLDNKSQPIFVLGSLMLEHQKWHAINNYFNKEKIKICTYFKDMEIHTNEIFNPHHKSIFHIKDWKNNLEILNKMVDLIMKLDIDFRFIAIDKKVFKLDVQEKIGNYIKIDPYIYAFCILYKYTSTELENYKDNGIIFLDEIVNIPENLKKVYPSLSIDNISIIEQALFLNSRDTNFLQIADVFSFYICQYLNIIKGYKKYSELKEKHCIDNYNKLISKTKLSHIEFLY